MVRAKERKAWLTLIVSLAAAEVQVIVAAAVCVYVIRVFKLMAIEEDDGKFERERKTELGVNLKESVILKLLHTHRVKRKKTQPVHKE